MDEITKKVLVSVGAMLERFAQSDTLTAHQVTEAQMGAAALGYELAKADEDPALRAEAGETERMLALELAGTLHKGQLAEPQRRWRESWQAGVGARLATVLSADHSGDEKPSRDEEVAAARRIRDFLVSYNEQFDSSVGDGPYSTYRGGRIDPQADQARTIYITAPSLESYLQARFPDQRGTSVLDVRRLTGGFSKETYIARLTDLDGENRIVIRKDGAGLPTGSSVVDEYKAIEQVLPFGVPAPTPLWLEPDTSLFGTAFMAVAFIEGEPAHMHLPKDRAGRLEWAEKLAYVTALIHSSTEVTGVDVREIIREEIASLERRVSDRERSPHPAISFGLSWLKDHLDDLKGRPACRVHGDIGFHNILVQDGEIKVLLDWEFSHLSDPVEDLIYVKAFMDELDAWQPFLAAYASRSRFTLDDKAAHYFAVWKSLRNAVACVGSLNSLLLPNVKDVALALAGNLFIPKYEIGILDSVIEGKS